MKAKPSVSQQDGGKGQGGLLGDILGGSSASVLVDEDFNPRASENSLSSPAGEFGDFTSAVGKAAASRPR